MAALVPYRGQAGKSFVLQRSLPYLRPVTILQKQNVFCTDPFFRQYVKERSFKS
jgi:hypothetical protein